MYVKDFGVDMVGRFLVDTNILIGVLNGTIAPSEIDQRGVVCISAVTAMELYALAGMSEHEQKAIDLYLLESEILPVTLPIARRAGLLARTRRKGKPDLIIAATALDQGIPLLTRNTKDFRISGLKLL